MLAFDAEEPEPAPALCLLTLPQLVTCSSENTKAAQTVSRMASVGNEGKAVPALRGLIAYCRRHHRAHPGP